MSEVKQPLISSDHSSEPSSQPEATPSPNDLSLVHALNRPSLGGNQQSHSRKSHHHITPEELEKMGNTQSMVSFFISQILFSCLSLLLLILVLVWFLFRVDSGKTQIRTIFKL
jgi:hypothetical protein